MRIAAVVVLVGCWGSADPPAVKPAQVTATDGERAAPATQPATPAGSPSISSAGVGSASDSDDAAGGTIGHGSGVVGTGMKPRTPGPNIKLDPPDIGAGGLDPEIVARYLKRHIMELQRCYERVLAHKPNIEGTVVATFTIGPDGHVTRGYATSFDPDVASCMALVIRRIEFPHGAHDTDVRYPIEVHPR